MEITKLEWDYELSKLKEVSDRLEDIIQKKEEALKYYKEDVVAVRKSMWEETDRFVSTETEKIIEVRQYLDAMKQQEKNYEFTSELLKKYKRMLPSPYFARIDFQEDNEAEAEKIYIGISSFIDEDTLDIIVYDWRAPVSSMFYEFELGPSSYESKFEAISGELKLKRQYKIADKTVRFMFDSSIKIDDEILQELLSKSVNDKMKTIVTSIQKEQNRIIRDDKNKLLIVQGAAGSGKTSIALHRVAYLLYKHRENAISSKNIVIFSPNQIFNDYISNVLPELGEENMLQTTFMEYAHRFIEKGLRTEDVNEQMEYILSRDQDDAYKTRVESISFKASEVFVKLVDRYLEFIEHDHDRFEDLFFLDKLVISKQDIIQLMEQEYRRWPYSVRLEKLKERIMMLASPLEKERYHKILEELLEDPAHKGDSYKRKKAIARLVVYQEYRLLRDKVYNMATVNIIDAYKRIFEDRSLLKQLADTKSFNWDIEAICQFTLESLTGRKIYYEDLIPYIYLRNSIHGVPGLSHIRHVVIDEAQDYTKLQYKIIGQLFRNCSFTVLGDLNQSIHPYMHTMDYTNVIDVFELEESELIRLTKSYRSTRQIIEFTRGILSTGLEVEHIGREGDKPKLIENSDGDMIKNIAEEVRELLERGYHSIAIICKTARECKELYRQIKDSVHVDLVTKDDDIFKKGVTIIPSYLSKGLEFDGVVLFQASAESYYKEDERRLFYTICTRALHSLSIYYSGKLSPFVEQVPADLYTKL